MKTKTIIFLVLTIFVIGIGAYSFKSDTKEESISIIDMLQRLNNDRYVSSDRLAEMIITHEPQLLVVDVRSKEDFSKFSLPGSVNIPLERLMDGDKIELLKSDGVNVVLVSNNGVNAQSAWMILQENERHGIRILKGGLNYWVKTILNPNDPGENCSLDVRGLYEFRLGASEYFAGNNKIVYTLNAEK